MRYFLDFAAHFPWLVLSLACIFAFAVVGFSMFLPPLVLVKRNSESHWGDKMTKGGKDASGDNSK